MAGVDSVADALDQIRGPPTTVTTYGPERDESLHAFLSRFDVALGHESLPVPANAGYLTVRRGGEYRGSVSASTYADVVDPPRATPWDSAVRESGYSQLGTLLADAQFTSLARSHLLATTREIEDRAFRVGRGTLYAGFQSLSAYRTQLPVYERLAAETDLTVHVYGAPDWTPPALDRVSVHTETATEGSDGDVADGNVSTSDELGAFWFVAFDGGGDDEMACALVAEQVSDDGYRGAWTYDATLVRAFTAYLDTTYGSSETGESDAGEGPRAPGESTGVGEREGSDEHNG
jgi:DICT domain-containing protein